MTKKTTMALCLGLSLNFAFGAVLPQEGQGPLFRSTDKQLEETFNWACNMAMSYAHDGNDPVGYWYEAALPQREAFCMRDVCHQSVGAQILGLARHNKNMLTHFVENISEEKDWCTYWEINRYNQPAPIDYKNDNEFWYNLCANPDVVQACLKMYEWTGDKDYLEDTRFTNFYDKSLDEYITRWQLSPEEIMSRPRFMNLPENFDPNYNFHACRGIASYVENFHGLSVGVDLIASLYAGYTAHARMALMNGQKKTARKDIVTAEASRALLDTQWWDAAHNRYQTFWTEEHKFYRGEGIPFLLWFGAVSRPERIRASVEDILQKEWNVENLSAFPALLYRFVYLSDAYRILVSLPHVDRCEYPEVSFGVIEGIVCGSAGILPSASESSIGTCYRLADKGQDIEVGRLPVFDGHITLRHSGAAKSRLENHTGRKITWKAAFPGAYSKVKAGKKTYKTIQTEDAKGNVTSTASIPLENGDSLTAEALKI